MDSSPSGHCAVGAESPAATVLGLLGHKQGRAGPDRRPLRPRKARPRRPCRLRGMRAAARRPLGLLPHDRRHRDPLRRQPPRRGGRRAASPALLPPRLGGQWRHQGAVLRGGGGGGGCGAVRCRRSRRGRMEAPCRRPGHPLRRPGHDRSGRGSHRRRRQGRRKRRSRRRGGSAASARGARGDPAAVSVGEEEL
ncbi:unnamed protein product [Phaeothamnion confervicola]